ncbi:hypothetical protein ACFQ1S_30000, partial [Kibdelosporangium lantanae]
LSSARTGSSRSETLRTYSRISGATVGVLCLLVVPWDAMDNAAYTALAAAATQNGLSRDVLAACGAMRTADGPNDTS